MSGQVTPHRQAPIDLRAVIERAAERLQELLTQAHPNHHDEGQPGMATHGPLPMPQCPWCEEDLDLVAELRALLPQPAPTCPNCRHADDRHGVGSGCREVIGDPATAAPYPLCPCAITHAALPQVRALLAAERDSKGDPAEPRVWNEGDADPSNDGVTELRDAHGSTWFAQRAGWSIHYANQWGEPDQTWREMDSDLFPFTEVLAGGGNRG